MNKLFIVIPFILLISVLVFATLKFGADAFKPKDKLINTKISGNILTFTSNEFSGTYELTLPDNVSIDNNDKVYISYNYNLGMLTRLNEIHVKDKFRINGEDIKKLNVKKLIH